MKKIVNVLMILACISAIVAITGCEWSSGGDSSWSGSPDWVNFSGVYRGTDGGLLVTDYTATPGTPGQTNTTSNTIGTGDGGSVYSGLSLGNSPVVEGSVTVTAGGYQFTDDGSGTLVGSVSGTSGTITYSTGIVNIDLGNMTLSQGEPINATYQYSVSGNAGSGPGPGTSEISIYTFTVHQEGNKLSITDNNGSVYKGKFGSVETTGGETDPADDDEDEGGGTTAGAGATAVAQYTVQGVSAAGVNVTMTGTMQGVLGGAGGAFEDRIMLGTWIEDPGRTGDIQGQASPIAVGNGDE